MANERTCLLSRRRRDTGRWAQHAPASRCLNAVRPRALHFAGSARHGSGLAGPARQIISRLSKTARPAISNGTRRTETALRGPEHDRTDTTQPLNSNLISYRTQNGHRRLRLTRAGNKSLSNFSCALANAAPPSDQTLARGGGLRGNRNDGQPPEVARARRAELLSCLNRSASGPFVMRVGLR